MCVSGSKKCCLFENFCVRKNVSATTRKRYLEKVKIIGNTDPYTKPDSDFFDEPTCVLPHSKYQSTIQEDYYFFHFLCFYVTFHGYNIL